MQHRFGGVPHRASKRTGEPLGTLEGTDDEQRSGAMRTSSGIQRTEVVLLDEQGEDSGITFWLEDVTEAETGPRRTT